MVKSRVAARGWATRASRNVESLCKTAGVGKVELSDAMDEFDKRLNTLDSIQSRPEVLLEVEDIDGDIEDAAIFRTRARESRVTTKIRPSVDAL